jgi:hypothetical protein
MTVQAQPRDLDATATCHIDLGDKAGLTPKASHPSLCPVLTERTIVSPGMPQGALRR